MAHNHNHAHGANERRLFWTALLTGGFMVAEAVGGIVAGSLALLADAGHMLADFAGLALAWFAFRMSRWPADQARTFGFERMQVLVAFGNGLLLFGIAAVIIVEAVQRIADPEPILSGTMLAVAIVGLIVNLAIFFVLRGGHRDNLNVRGAMLHVLGDLLGSAGAIVAAIVIALTDWTLADPLVSVLVTVLILRSAWFLVRDAGHILIEGTPSGMSLHEIEADLEASIPGVENVHHLHAWSITEERKVMTLHARIAEGADSDGSIQAIKTRLRDRFGIAHSTIEIEREGCADAELGEDHHHAASDAHVGHDHDEHDHDHAHAHAHAGHTH